MIQDILTVLVIGIIFAALYSACTDIASYEQRQADWEKAHPDQTYIRGYRKLKRKGKI